MPHQSFRDDKKEGRAPEESLDDEIMGKTMMDIDLKEGGASGSSSADRKKEPLTSRDKSEESVEDLLKKEKSFFNKIGLGKLFQKKKG